RGRTGRLLMDRDESVAGILPEDHKNATLVGRVFDPIEGGPSVVAIRRGDVEDLSHVEPTMSSLLERDDVIATVRNATPRKTWKLEDVLSATLRQDLELPHF